MFSRFERLIIAIMFALLAAGITLVIASAQGGSPVQPAQGTPPCTSCHTEFATTWQSGPHGQAVTDPVFSAEWTNQGKPGACLVCHVTGYDPATATWKADGVSCEACHGPMVQDHPKNPMPVDRSPELCARCHSDTRFGWQEWQGSTHYQRGMNCTTCHDPHSASLKVVPGDRNAAYKDASNLCITCHTEVSMDFPYSAHHQQGVSCVDCHVKHMEDANRAAHTVPDHSFRASLDTCNKCHASQMHSSTQASGTTVPQTLPTVETQIKEAGLTAEPTPVSPIGYAGLAGLIGLAAGMVMAPWLEKWYRRAVKHEEIEND